MTNNETSERLSSSLELHQEKIVPLELIEERLMNANSPEEVDLWIRTRQEIIKQNELIKHYQQQRFIDTFQIIRQTSLFGILISIGIALIISRLTIPGLVIIAIVFYEMSLDYRRYLTFKKTNFEDSN